MKINDNKHRGRDWYQLDNYWVKTNNKCARSEDDFECALNRLYYLAKSNVAFNSAHVITNSLLYLSMMYKACYQHTLLLDAHHTFVEKIVLLNKAEPSQEEMQLCYQSAFCHCKLQTTVSQEFSKRLMERYQQDIDKARVFCQYFTKYRLTILHLITQLKQLAKGYQEGGELARRAFLFAKLFSIVDLTVEHFCAKYSSCLQSGIVDCKENRSLNAQTIHSILPNLNTTIGIFDFGICFQESHAIQLEMRHKLAISYEPIIVVKRDSMPSSLTVLKEASSNLSKQQQFYQGVISINENKKLASNKAVNDSPKNKAEVYLASCAYGKIFRFLFNRLKPKMLTRNP